MKKTDKISEIWTAIDMMGAGDKIEIEKFSDYVVIEKVPKRRNINIHGVDLSILNEEDWFYAELYSGHVKWLNRGKMFDKNDRESISYQCEENKIYKEGRLCRKDDIRVLRKATPSDLAPFFEKHPEYEPVNKNITANCLCSWGLKTNALSK